MLGSSPYISYINVLPRVPDSIINLVLKTSSESKPVICRQNKITNGKDSSVNALSLILINWSPLHWFTFCWPPSLQISYRQHVKFPEVQNTASCCNQCKIQRSIAMNRKFKNWNEFDKSLINYLRLHIVMSDINYYEFMFFYFRIQYKINGRPFILFVCLFFNTCS